MFGWTCGRAESDGRPATRRRVPVQGHSGRRPASYWAFPPEVDVIRGELQGLDSITARLILNPSGIGATAVLLYLSFHPCGYAAAPVILSASEERQSKRNVYLILLLPSPAER